MFKKDCFLCGSRKLKKILDLGMQPWCNDFSKNKVVKKYPLSLNYCLDCSNVQISYVIDKKKMFLDHKYLSGTNYELIKHFKKISKEIIKKFQKKSLSVLDLGSNDGSFLLNFKNKKNINILGVESCKNIARISLKNKIKTINKFFDYKLALQINREFDCIHASGFFFHLQDLKSVTKGIKHLLACDGIFIIEFLYMKKIIEKNFFDQIYHEHLNYYNLQPLQSFLYSYDLEIFDVKSSPIHGGSLIVYVAHKGIKEKTKRYLSLLKTEQTLEVNNQDFYLNFQSAVDKRKIMFKQKISLLRDRGFNIYGVGAPAKASVFLNYCNISNKDLPNGTLENNYLKFNKFIPGTNIKIIDEKKISKKIYNKKDIFLILSWNFKNSIIKKYKKKFGNNFKYFLPH
jgi:hypothetical protein